MNKRHLAAFILFLIPTVALNAMENNSDLNITIETIPGEV
jgi:hypothetical protein